MRRTLILLYAYKAYQRTQPRAREFVAVRLPFNEETYYGNGLMGDCYVTIAKRWLEAGFVDAVKGIAIQYPGDHPRHSPAGVMEITKGFDFYILEDISQYPSVHTAEPSDILFIRGQPPWEPVVEQHADSYKIFCGPTGYQWQPRYQVDAILVNNPEWSLPGIKCVELFKCCDEEIFKPLSLQKTYDVCFIARFDRRDGKGQLEFARFANKKWKAMFVGEPADNRGVEALRKLWPSCEIVGERKKSQVNEVLNRSKVSVVFSRPGRDDGCTRVITESLAAGTPVVIHKRNLGRKYITRLSGEVTGSLLYRWKVESVIRNFERYRPREEYEGRFESRKVAQELWQRLGLG